MSWMVLDASRVMRLRIGWGLDDDDDIVSECSDPPDRDVQACLNGTVASSCATSV